MLRRKLIEGNTLHGTKETQNKTKRGQWRLLTNKNINKTEVSHLQRRVTSEIRTSDAWPTKHDGQSDRMSDKLCMRTGTEQETEAIKHPHVTDRNTA